MRLFWRKRNIIVGLHYTKRYRFKMDANDRAEALKAKGFGIEGIVREHTFKSVAGGKTESLLMGWRVKYGILVPVS